MAKSKKKKNLTAKIFAITLLVIMIGSMIAGLILR
jgi:hypothetical protein